MPVTRRQTFAFDELVKVDRPPQRGQEMPVRHHGVAAVAQQIDHAPIFPARQSVRLEVGAWPIALEIALVMHIWHEVLNQRIMRELRIDAEDDASEEIL